MAQILLKRSELKDPIANDLATGEIAIRYDKGKEALFIKNKDNEIIKFVPESKIVALEERVTALESKQPQQ